ncbi:hypothetical protein G7Y89_g14533 [Cudoniella acicularis]|uniref:Pyridoxamine 5'-phosphate oxidase N-terminal domain-containing protein n=1 Tax=Cudoniella acicularis TaxID=354080 RepID=A0A8H4R2F6_9HELO|nr:hypothetical protein G7Y89_g14533 [Cudoniella acicularis]
MVQFFPTLTESHTEWCLSQPLFFTASAPLHGTHINISPKGLPTSTFTIFSPSQCGYIDATGSGAETISHIYENGRVTIMFCSFGPSPRIMRLFCTGRVVEWDTSEFETLIQKIGKKRVDGARAVIILDIWKVQTSCGYGVPKVAMKKVGNGDEEKAEDVFEDRDTLGHWAGKQVEKNEIGAYQMKNNAESLDGLPGLKSARRDRGEWIPFVDARVWAKGVLVERGALTVGFLMGVVMVLLMQFLQRLLSV